MASKIKLSELKKAIHLAEEVLEELKENDKRHLKQMRIKRALSRAYKLLNRKDYTQREVDRMTRIVYRSLRDGLPIIWFYLFGIILAGAVLFASYETYSFIRYNWDVEHHITPHDDVSHVVSVVYKESNIVSLYNLLSVPNSVGLNNPKQEFNISNDPDQMPRNFDYLVNYQINIAELNDNISKVIDKRYIRYQLTHYDAEDGVKTSEEIGRLSDLPQNTDGTYRLYSGTQEKEHQTNFEMVIWIGEDAPNSQQGRAYNFAFRVVAAVSAK